MIGRLTNDVELRHTNEGTPVASFSIAVPKSFVRAGEADAEFFNVTVWNKQAENCHKFIGKGRQVAIEGRLEIDRYTDKDGNNRQSPRIVASTVTFLGSKNDTPISTEENDVKPSDFKVEDNPYENFASEIEENGISDDDLPF